MAIVSSRSNVWESSSDLDKVLAAPLSVRGLRTGVGHEGRLGGVWGPRRPVLGGACEAVSSTGTAWGGAVLLASSGLWFSRCLELHILAFILIRISLCSHSLKQPSHVSRRCLCMFASVVRVWVP